MKLFDRLLGVPAGAKKPVHDVEVQRQKVAELEKKLFHRLPDDYRQFLMQAPEKEPFLNTFDVQLSESDANQVLYSFTVKKFLSANAGETDDLLLNYNKYETSTPIPHLLPVAFDRFRNMMMLSLDDYKIYFWDYHSKVEETKVHPDMKRGDRLYWVADNFDSFYSRLYRANRFK